jgi:hypothetical protein
MIYIKKLKKFFQKNEAARPPPEPKKRTLFSIRHYAFNEKE